MKEPIFLQSCNCPSHNLDTLGHAALHLFGKDTGQNECTNTEDDSKPARFNGVFYWGLERF